MEKIFVQIAAYRDPECTHTIRDIFNKARNPERIKIAVCWQYRPGEDDNLLTIDEANKDRVVVDSIDCNQSLGVCWARNRLQKHYSGEEYTLMIDSHMRFAESWDKLLIEELKKCPSQKPVLSNHPAGYTFPDNIDVNAKLSILKVKPFNKNGDIRVSGELLDKFPDKPLKGAFLAAGFIFTLGSFVKEIPYDPNYYFDQEEICLSARAWTNGWDIFSPSKIFIYHNYITAANAPKRPLHWSDNRNWSELGRKSRERYLHLLGIKPSFDQNVLVDIDKYSLGTTRSLKDYENYCGIDFANCVASPKALGCGFIENLSEYKTNPINTDLKNEVPDFLERKVSGQNVFEQKISEQKAPAEKITEQKLSQQNNQIIQPDKKDISKLGLFNLNMFRPDNNAKFDSDKPLGFTQLTSGLPPEVLVLENFVPKEFCQSICDYADEVIGRKLMVVDNENSTKEKLVTKESTGRITEYVAIDGVAGEILSVFMDIYTRRLAPFYNDAKFEWFERPQILRYLPGGKYDPHADAEHVDKNTKQWVRAQDRDYSVLLYLNEEYEGGMLNFVNYNYKIKPKTGMVIGFPSDRKYLHAAEPTLSGKRYVIVSWGAILGTPRVKASAPYASVFLNLRR